MQEDKGENSLTDQECRLTNKDHKNSQELT